MSGQDGIRECPASQVQRRIPSLGSSVGSRWTKDHKPAALGAFDHSGSREC